MDLGIKGLEIYWIKVNTCFEFKDTDLKGGVFLKFYFSGGV